MIFDRITLHNFGAYSGTQEAILTPESRDKPIILFGGMNGGGKTTLLDSIQLGLYGKRAKTSNRGSLGYQSYLAECINRSADPNEGAAITIAYHRMQEGQRTHYLVERSWRLMTSTGKKTDQPKVVETLRVSRDGQPDALLSEHWDEAIDAYLPVGIAHLFFFDGEQIKDLAEGKHAADILGTAIHSLLGLDLVDRLDTDLRVFERRKRAENMDEESLLKLRQAEADVSNLDEEQSKIAQKQGRLTNEAGRLAAEVKEAEARFSAEGGDLFLRHQEFQEQHDDLSKQKNIVEEQLRTLAAGLLPLLLVRDQLAEVQEQVAGEADIQQARVLSQTLESRDSDVLDLLKEESVGKSVLARVRGSLAGTRHMVEQRAAQPLILDAGPAFGPELFHLRETLLPEAEAESQSLLVQLADLDEQIAHLDTELARTPDEDRIAKARAELGQTRAAHSDLLAQLETLQSRKETLARQREQAERNLSRVELESVDLKFADDARQRMLHHSGLVRDTLAKFKVRIIRKHTQRIESLMLESFRSLLRKQDLVSGLMIDPESFAITLLDRDGKPLPFDRLSAGERQLLATSLLWGLARASGRPIPTIIDTPLGRLDSSHRKHLIERYFPAASHQVILLSTDEEIVDEYHENLKPFVSRTYHLAHDEALGTTSVQLGYFPKYEAAR